jgi:hypothetical protein
LLDGKIVCSYIGSMNCRTWDQLFEEYEKATFERVARVRGTLGAKRVEELERVNQEIARTLRDLREHEMAHRCHS